MSVAFPRVDPPGNEQSPSRPEDIVNWSKMQKKQANSTKAFPQKSRPLMNSKNQSNETIKPPVEIRAKLVAEGFTTTQVANAVDEMRARKKAFDEINSVRSFLRSQDGIEKGHHELGSPNISDHFPPEEENTASTEASTADARAQETLDNEHEDVTIDKGTHNEDSSFDDHMASSIAQSRQSRSLHPQPLDISSRLDLVADFENLLDAAFALSEWVTREAKETEVRANTSYYLLCATGFYEHKISSCLYVFWIFFLHIARSSLFRDAACAPTANCNNHVTHI
jgi:hypothetical protein